MPTQETPTTALTTRLVAAVGNFAPSQVGWRGKLMFAES
jgi:hypothetical protein